MSDWRPVVGWEGRYEVSCDGEVRSLDREVIRRDGTRQNFKGRVLGHYANSAGYKLVRLSDQSNGLRECARVHRLVAEAFIPNPESKPEVNHIDGNKYNSSLNNLEWVTSKENRIHAWRTGLRNRSHLPVKNGESNVNSKLSDEKVIEMLSLRNQGVSYKRLAKHFDVSKKTVIDAVKGRSWCHVNRPSPSECT